MEPSAVVRAVPNVCYSLEFSATLTRWKGKRKVMKRHVEAARDMLEDTWFWQEWLASTMRDAAENEVEEFLGVCVDAYGTPPVLDIVVELDPAPKKTRRNPEGHNEITGVISWRSIPAGDKALEDAIEWRLGDRLSNYGIQNESEGWICFFSPGTLTIQ